MLNVGNRACMQCSSFIIHVTQHLKQSTLKHSLTVNSDESLSLRRSMTQELENYGMEWAKYSSNSEGKSNRDDPIITVIIQSNVNESVSSN